MTRAEPAGGVKLSDEQRLDWLRLIRSENVGPRTFRALVNHCGGARQPGRMYTVSEAEQEMETARRQRAVFIAMGEPDYPARLRMIDDAPPLIAVRGRIDALK